MVGEEGRRKLFGMKSGLTLENMAPHFIFTLSFPTGDNQKPYFAAAENEVWRD